MSEQERKELLESIRSQLSGELTKDLLFLQSQAEQYEKQEGGAALADDLLQLAYTLMPEEQTDYMKKMLYIGDRRLDQVYADAETLMKGRKKEEALALTEQLFRHITENFAETPEQRFFSFRNLLESNLYHYLYHPTKQLMKAPFDFALFLGAHAYNLVELLRLDEALAVLEEAIRFNPVSPDPRFELAEVYKLMKRPDKLLEAVRDTLPICTSAYSLARCYANLGFWCVENDLLDDAVCFYFESLLFAEHPAVRSELAMIAQRQGRPVVPPEYAAIQKTFEKYQLRIGPSDEVLYVASTLYEQAKTGGRWEEAVYYMTVISSLTNDPKAAEQLKQAREELEKSKN